MEHPNGDFAHVEVLGEPWAGEAREGGWGSEGGKPHGVKKLAIARAGEGGVGGGGWQELRVPRRL